METFRILEASTFCGRAPLLQYKFACYNFGIIIETEGGVSTLAVSEILATILVFLTKYSCNSAWLVEHGWTQVAISLAILNFESHKSTYVARTMQIGNRE